MELIATCAFGLEKLVYNELKALGLWVVSTEDGRVTFEGEKKDIIRTNLWLRTADRIQIKLAAAQVTTFDELFALVENCPWELYIGQADVFPVLATSVKSQLHSVPAIQSIVKKAVVKRLMGAHKTTILPESTGITYTIHARINKDYVMVTIDTSGDGLNKRGYRLKTNKAPLRETMAAALVTLSDWTHDRPLLDPFCGSGTILIEAAMIATNTAPGLKRSFAFEQWSWMSADDIAEERKIAKQAYVHRDLHLYGTDIDIDVIPVARDNAVRAGFHTISFEERDMKEVQFGSYPHACVVTNPPYGERLEDVGKVQRMYKDFGFRFSAVIDASLFLLTADEQFPTLFGRPADKNRKLFNGNIRCYLYSYMRAKKST